MKNHYRFLALLVSCTLSCAAPMSALCSEAAPAGETAAAETEIAEIEEPATEELPEEAEAVTEETGGITEETVEETGSEADAPDDTAGEDEEEPVVAEEPEGAAEEAAEEEEVEAEPASVTEGYCGEELTWEYRDGALSIKGTGAMYDYDEEHQPEWLVFAEETEELRVEKGITRLDVTGQIDNGTRQTKLEAV